MRGDALVPWLPYSSQPPGLMGKWGFLGGSQPTVPWGHSLPTHAYSHSYIRIIWKQIVGPRQLSCPWREKELVVLMGGVRGQGETYLAEHPLPLTSGELWL